MPHLDEGAIQAYLDRQLEYGEDSARSSLEEHVKHCSSCRNLFDEIAELNEASDDILSSVGPEMPEAPQFEELKKRAEVRSGRRQLSAMQRAGWAATIVIAVGLGWYARGSFTNGQGPAVPADISPTGVPIVAVPAESDSEEPAETARAEDPRPTEPPSQTVPAGPVRSQAVSQEAATDADLATRGGRVDEDIGSGLGLSEDRAAASPLASEQPQAELPNARLRTRATVDSMARARRELQSRQQDSLAESFSLADNAPGIDPLTVMLEADWSPAEADESGAAVAAESGWNRVGHTEIQGVSWVWFRSVSTGSLLQYYRPIDSTGEMESVELSPSGTSYLVSGPTASGLLVGSSLTLEQARQLLTDLP